MKYKTLKDGTFIQKQDYSKTIIFSLEDFVQPGHQLQIVTIPAQTKQRKHLHFKQTEVWYMLEGECKIVVNDQVFNSVVGDSFISSPGDTHYLWNQTDKDVRVLVFKINLPENDEDTQWFSELI